MRERDWIEKELRNAVSTGEIAPVFKPSVDLRTGQVTGFEVSPHWRHPEVGEISSNRFMAIAEERGLIHEIMDDLLRQACRAALRWPTAVSLAIDILLAQLKDPTLGARILDILYQSGFDPQRLELEITEAALVRDLEAAQHALNGLGKQEFVSHWITSVRDIPVFIICATSSSTRSK